MDDMLMAAIVAGEETEAVILFGVHRSRGLNTFDAVANVMESLDL